MNHFRISIALLSAVVSSGLAPARATPPPGEGDVAAAPEKGAVPTTPKRLDRSGRKRVGTASVYARRFGGRKMADGTRMGLERRQRRESDAAPGHAGARHEPEDRPLATVTIQDRGPYAKGRIVDLSPGTAREIGLTPREGVAPVEVVPITVPLPAGGVKIGDAAREEVGR